MSGQYTGTFLPTFNTTANGVKDIASFSVTTSTSGQVSFDISIVNSQTGCASTKRYLIAAGYNFTAGAWQRCIPLSSYNGAADAHELQVQSSTTGANLTRFRLVHTNTAFASTPTVSITAAYAQDVPVVINLTTNSQYTDVNWATYGFASSCNGWTS
jgi:hypothetical protein